MPPASKSGRQPVPRPDQLRRVSPASSGWASPASPPTRRSSTEGHRRGHDYRPALDARSASLGAERATNGWWSRTCSAPATSSARSSRPARATRLREPGILPGAGRRRGRHRRRRRRLRAAVARDNLLVKIPATASPACAPSKPSPAVGVSLNVTLMFSLAHVDAVAGATSAASKARRRRGASPACVRWRKRSSCPAGTA